MGPLALRGFCANPRTGRWVTSPTPFLGGASPQEPGRGASRCGELDIGPLVCQEPQALCQPRVLVPKVPAIALGREREK